MNKEHHLIYIPGLHDQHPFNKFFTDLFPHIWTAKGFPTEKFEPHWEEGTSLDPKLNKLLAMIDQITQDGHNVSLIGQSAGGSLALNAFTQRKKTVLGAINLCGRLREGSHVKPTMSYASRHSVAFRQSVRLFEQVNEPKLTIPDRKRIMTIKAWIDKTVPSTTTPLEGAHNLTIPFVGHNLTGGLMCSFRANTMLNFLKSLE